MKKIIFAAVFFPVLLAACGTTTGGEPSRLKKAPDVDVPLRQRTTYNGKAQPIQVDVVEDKAPLVITYFDSAKALEDGKGGSSEAPVDGGLYFVRIERPEGNGYAAGDDIVIEYRIDARAVRIIAGDRQEAVYDGNPKRVKAESDPPLALSFSYFPNRESMMMVFRSVERQFDRQGNVPRGYTRVERPPIEPGTYYVLVYFSGSRNYRSASKEIEFTINPPGR
jgi:hypothetical protein